MDQTSPSVLQTVGIKTSEVLWILRMSFNLVKLMSLEVMCYKGNTWLQKDKNIHSVLPDQKAGAGQGILDGSEITADKEKKSIVTYRVRLLSQLIYL